MGSAVRFARVIHVVSALWAMALALLIFADVTGRGLLSRPVPGTKELIQNSVVAITFLQIPLAIYSGSMLRTTILADAVPALARRLLRTLAALLGIAFFVGLAISSWQPFLDAMRIGEYEGEGALRVVTWPVRGLLVVMAAYGAIAYAMMIFWDWRGELDDETAAPGAVIAEGEVARTP